jgi:hypothetical protein
MGIVIFHCPATNQSVQGFVAEGLIGPNTIWVPIDCPICNRWHLIHPATIKIPKTDEK